MGVDVVADFEGEVQEAEGAAAVGVVGDEI